MMQSTKTPEGKHVKPLLVIVTVFLVSRTVCYYLGIRFDAYFDEHLMHFVSPELLKTELLKSVFHLHNQPPGFNVLLGIVFKLFPDHYAVAFHVLYIFMGVVLTASLYFLMTGMGASTIIAVLLTCIFIASPSCILFENLMLYSYPVTALLCLSAYFLVRYLKRGSPSDCTVFFVAVALIALTISLFHLVWVAGAAFLLLMRGRTRRHVVIACAAPCLFVIMLYVKNLYLVGSFSGSTWLGMSLSKMTTQNLPVDKRIDMVKQGKLSELALLPPFKPIWYYRQHVRIPRFRETGIPVLDLEYYPDIGHNWNNAALYSISKQYQREAFHVLRHNPAVYLESVASSFRIFSFPSSDWFHYFTSVDNISRITVYERLYNRVVYGQIQSFPDTWEKREDREAYYKNPRHCGIFIILAYITALAYGIKRSLRLLRPGIQNDAMTTATAYLTLTILYVMFAGNLLETGENERFRFYIDPFMLTLLGLIAQDSAERIIQWKKIPSAQQ